MGCTANRLSQTGPHVGDHMWTWADERFLYPALDNSSHRSLLWWRHPIFSTCPVQLTSWHSCRGENRHLSPSLKHQKQPCYLPLLQLSIRFPALYTVNWLIPGITVHYHQQLQTYETVTLEYIWRKLAQHRLQWQWNWRINDSWLSKSFINMLRVSMHQNIVW